MTSQFQNTTENTVVLAVGFIILIVCILHFLPGTWDSF